MHENSGVEALSRISRDASVNIRPVQNPPNILALVIGINKYTGGTFEYNNLTGAVGDADAFEEFLTTRLKVPRKNICSLRDERASRQKILDGFRFLRDNQTYPKDQVEIIIYYAGHGAQESIPPEWEGWYTPTGRIEMLCPSDIGTLKNDGRAAPSVVPGIPDRTISGLLDQISSRKGNHITVILDCCSSAGMNRGGMTRSSGWIPRQMFDPPPLTGSTDQDLLQASTPAMRSSQEVAAKFHGAHVLLAACGREQMAWEDPKSKRGLFTYSLLKILMSDELETLTYRSLMDKLRMPKNQTPHCEGQGINRLLFGNKGFGDTSFIYASRSSNGTIALEAGSAQGITIGSRFVVHRTDLLNNLFHPNPPLGYLVATSVGPFSSVLESLDKSRRFRPPQRFYCKTIGGAPRSISLYSKDTTWLKSIFLSEYRPTPLVNVVDAPAGCQLELSISRDNRIYFDRHNDPVIPYIGSRLPYTIDKNDPALHKVVDAARHFHYHLTRMAPDDASDVRMELRLLQEIDFDPYPDFRPIGKNLIAEEPAIVKVDEDRCFGISIINDSDRVLYPYLFYFDPNDLTITEIYSPPLGAGYGRLISNVEIEQPSAPIPTNDPIGALPTIPSRLKIGVDAALPPKAHLTIGYGNGGCKPWQFYVPDGKDKDVGFLRLFLSTRPGNFQNIIQWSPFEENRGSGRRIQRSGLEEVEWWMVKTATIVQIPTWMRGNE